MFTNRRILTLNNCDGLKCAQLTSKSIQFLRMTNCKGMKRLSCKCPALQELRVRPRRPSALSDTFAFSSKPPSSSQTAEYVCAVRSNGCAYNCD